MSIRPRVRGARDWPPIALLLPVLLALLLAAYYPAWHGGPLWDDDAHLTRDALRSGAGLWRIWFEPGATQQYYPILHSASGFCTNCSGTRRSAITSSPSASTVC